MPAQRLPMRQVREVLRLKHLAGFSNRRIAESVGISRYTVAEYVRRAAVVGITWPVPAELDDTTLEARLFSLPFAAHELLRPQPDWPRIHAELRRPGVTLLLLWEEYRAGQPEGYGYSRFCDLYREWRAGASPTMRQTHVAGERLFVDFAGQTIAVVDPLTGISRPAQIFVAALGASNYTYAEARWTQGLVDWIGCHVTASGSSGNHRRSPRPRVDHRHQPTANRELACAYRQSHDRRRHTRPACAQRPSPGAERRVAAQAARREEQQA
jgi:hypothetical protein